jgi:hypothetical protein
MRFILLESISFPNRRFKQNNKKLTNFCRPCPLSLRLVQVFVVRARVVVVLAQQVQQRKPRPLPLFPRLFARPPQLSHLVPMRVKSRLSRRRIPDVVVVGVVFFDGVLVCHERVQVVVERRRDFRFLNPRLERGRQFAKVVGRVFVDVFHG